MIGVIIAVVIILYVIFIGFTIHNLNMLDKPKKITLTIISLIVMAIITLIVFSISKSGIEYPQKEMIGTVRNMLIAIFTPINVLIVIPYVANMINKIKIDDITPEKFQKGVILIGIIFLIVLILECSYLKDIQLGIIDMLNARKD